MAPPTRLPEETFAMTTPRQLPNIEGKVTLKMSNMEELVV